MTIHLSNGYILEYDVQGGYEGLFVNGNSIPYDWSLHTEITFILDKVKLNYSEQMLLCPF